MEEEPKVKEKVLPSVKENPTIGSTSQSPKITKDLGDAKRSTWKFPWDKSEPIDTEPKDSLRAMYKGTKEGEVSDSGYGYTYYIIAGVVIIASGFIVYYYWDNITNLFKKGDDKGKGRETFTFDPQTGDYVSTSSGSEPSIPGKYYPEGFLKYFSRKMANMSEQVNNRAKELYNSGTNLFTNPFKRDAGPLIPRREFDESFIPPQGNIPAVCSEARDYLYPERSLHQMGESLLCLLIVKLLDLLMFLIIEG
jgi:hypothetical protein